MRRGDEARRRIDGFMAMDAQLSRGKSLLVMSEAKFRSKWVSGLNRGLSLR